MSGYRSKQIYVGIITLLLIGISLAACGSGSGSSNGDSSGVLRLSTLGLCDEIPVYWAQEKKIFQDHGLEVELVKSSGGAAALTALQSGDLDLAFANPFSATIAVSQGLDLRWVATAYETEIDEEKGANAVTVTKDSGLKEAKDLEGKTIAVNEIGGINEIIVSKWMSMNGADPQKADFVALPFNELASSVANNKVDAAQIPAQEVNPDLNLMRLSDPYVAVGGGKSLIFAGYVTTADTAESRSEEMKAFQAALIEANEDFLTEDNSDERFVLMSERCKQDEDYLRSINEHVFEARVDLDALKRTSTILEQQERINERVEADELVPSYTASK